tara:strand:+ start:227 stop:397 length:171 start_codon:yes stop_codon:yes gene_type:complete
VFLFNNPDTKKPEIFIRFTNFESEQQAMEFVKNFKQLPEYQDYVDLKETEELPTIH